MIRQFECCPFCKNKFTYIEPLNTYYSCDRCLMAISIDIYNQVLLWKSKNIALEFVSVSQLQKYLKLKAFY
jgi:predicted amidophosphoribosyltransferase